MSKPKRQKTEANVVPLKSVTRTMEDGQSQGIPLDEFGVPPLGAVHPLQYAQAIQELQAYKTRCGHLELRVKVLEETLQLAVNPNRPVMSNPIGEMAKTELSRRRSHKEE